MRLDDMKAEKRTAEVRRALACVLQDLAVVSPTPEIVAACVRRLRGWEVEADTEVERKLVARQVSDAAPACSQAQSDGTFMRYGRTMRRWKWYPASMVGSSVTIAPRPAQTTVVTQPPRNPNLMAFSYDITDPAAVLAARRFLEWVEIVRAQMTLADGMEPATEEAGTDWTVPPEDE